MKKFLFFLFFITLIFACGERKSTQVDSPRDELIKALEKLHGADSMKFELNYTAREKKFISGREDDDADEFRYNVFWQKPYYYYTRDVVGWDSSLRIAGYKTEIFESRNNRSWRSLSKGGFPNMELLRLFQFWRRDQLKKLVKKYKYLESKSMDGDTFKRIKVLFDKSKVADIYPKLLKEKYEVEDFKLKVTFKTFNEIYWINSDSNLICKIKRNVWGRFMTKEKVLRGWATDRTDGKFAFTYKIKDYGNTSIPSNIKKMIENKMNQKDQGK